MDTPQEIEVWFILPGLRREFVMALKKQGMPQREIANILNMTEPAVSQYLNNKRGITRFNQTIIKKIAIAAEKIKKGQSSLRQELQKMLKIIKDTKFICGVCHDHLNTTEDCKVCYV